MGTGPLDDPLDRLAAELARTRAATEEAEAKLAELRRLVAEARAGAASAAARSSLAARLRASLRGFEADHPALVAATEEVAEALGKVGI
ncbi:MAG TPA: DUF4404 family protein [Minicystis sp.]|nr:DUF4404 family protein [Minicystis sp.]